MFHNPDDLDDSELYVLRKKIQLQMYMPYWGALFTGVTMRILDAQILRRAASFSRIGVATAFGFYLGACGANRLHSNLWRSFDEDITNAFDERYVKRALNVSGLNSNWVQRCFINYFIKECNFNRIYQPTRSKLGTTKIS